MSETNGTTSGRCLCGHVGFSYAVRETWACYCHCGDCRRNCAAPVVAFIGVPESGFAWHMGDGSAAPKFYSSSPGVKRFFCDHCGTPMAFQADKYVGEIHLYAATLDDPAGFTPRFHVHYGEKLEWLHLTDDLPRYAAAASPDETDRV